MGKSVSRFLSTRKFSNEIEVFPLFDQFISYSFRVTAKKKWFKRSAEPANPKLFSRRKRSSVNVSVGYIMYFLQLDVSISEFSGFRF